MNDQEETGRELLVTDKGLLSAADAGKRKTDLLVELAKHWAARLMDIVEKCDMRTVIGEKKYLEVEGWQLIGEFANVRDVIEWTRPWIVDNELKGYEARCNIINEVGEIITSGESSCGFDAFPCRGKEGSEKDKAARSAAQTWSISRAYRNRYGYVAKLAGYEAVPAEEITGQVEKKLPPCPKCGKPGFESKYEDGGYYCWTKKGGCGHKWGQPEKETEAKSDSKAGNGTHKPGAYPITPTHEKLYSLIEFECQGDMIKMGDMLESLTKWTDAKEKVHPGKREVGQISVKQAEYAIEHFKEQFGEREPGSDG